MGCVRRRTRNDEARCAGVPAVAGRGRAAGGHYAGWVALNEELARAARAAAAFAAPGEELAGVLPAEPREGHSIYLCAFVADGERLSWVALDADGRGVSSREIVRDAASIIAMCELAEETAAGGDLDELRGQLVSLRLTENPPGIEEAERAALALQHAIAPPPRTATPAYLDAVGTATRQLEQALGEDGISPFAEAMKASMHAVESLTAEIESNYKLVLT